MNKRHKHLPGHIGTVCRKYGRDKPVRFYPTGIKELDQFTGGIPSGEMTLIAARPSEGKTALAVQVLEHIAERNEEAVGMFSIEMPTRAIVSRMIVSRTGLPSVPLRKGELNQRQIATRDRALASIRELPFFIDERSLMTPDRVERMAKVWIRGGVKVLALDYVQLMTAGRVGTPGETRGNFIGECARHLKNIARDHDVPFIVLSQLNRESSRGRRPPTMADLRESGDLEQVADNIILLHPDQTQPPYIDLILAKWRNGQRGTISAHFDSERTTFKSVEREDE